MFTDHPIHYNEGNIECIDAIKESMPHAEYMGFLKGNVLKYVWRYEYKDGVDDLKKARNYIDWMINSATESDLKGDVKSDPHQTSRPDSANRN